MTDGWEHTHSLNPLANEASGDADGDQLSNLSNTREAPIHRTIDTDRTLPIMRKLSTGRIADRTSLPLPECSPKMNYAGLVINGQDFSKWTCLNLPSLKRRWTNDPNWEWHRTHRCVPVAVNRKHIHSPSVPCHSPICEPWVFTRNGVRLKI